MQQGTWIEKIRSVKTFHGIAVADLALTALATWMVLHARKDVLASRKDPMNIWIVALFYFAGAIWLGVLVHWSFGLCTKLNYQLGVCRL